MIRSTLGVFAVVAVLSAAGCSQDTSPPAEGTDAEIPGPGPAADPGPAPEDQWEPPVENETGTDAPEPDEGNTSETAPQNGNGDSEAPADNTAEDVSLKVQSWEETEKLIASHRGKIVVVDFWSTSCLPCRREFPQLVELHNTHRGEIACVSISLDYSGRASRPPESYREQVHRFLAEQGATFDNVLSSDDPDKLQVRLKLAPIPLVWIYDREGNLSRQFDNTDPNQGEFTYTDDVRPYVESLLAGG